MKRRPISIFLPFFFFLYSFQRGKKNKFPYKYYLQPKAPSALDTTNDKMPVTDLAEFISGREHKSFTPHFGNSEGHNNNANNTATKRTSQLNCLRVKRLSPKAKLPIRCSDLAAGYDLSRYKKLLHVYPLKFRINISVCSFLLSPNASLSVPNLRLFQKTFFLYLKFHYFKKVRQILWFLLREKL